MKINKQKNILRKMYKQNKKKYFRHFLLLEKRKIDFKGRFHLIYSISSQNKIMMFKNSNIMFLIF